MNYDYDIIVVGAGPAGLSAALRARWLRAYKALPASVAIIDHSGVGGISNWYDVLLKVTGPSFKMDVRKIVDDFKRLPVDIIQEKVVGSSLKGKIKRIKCSRRTYTCRSVIVCTGIKTLANEKDYVGRGLIKAVNDYNYMANVLEPFCEDNRGKVITIWGTKKVIRLVEYFNSINRGRLKVNVLVEPPLDGKYRGCVEGTLFNIKGGRRISKLECSTPKGHKRTIPTDFLMLDFESYMLFTNSTAGFRQLKKKNGFVRVNHDLFTGIPNVFAAGDVTGPPFCVAKAVGEGVKAGFEAYISTYKDKFGFEPCLYEYYPSRGGRIVVGKTGFRIPELRDGFYPKQIAPMKLTGKQREIARRFDGKTRLKALKRRYSLEDIRRTIELLVEKKALAIHV